MVIRQNCHIKRYPCYNHLWKEVIIMAFEELDTISEKLLDIFKKHGTLTLSELSVLVNIDQGAFAGYIQILLNKGYLVNSAIGKEDDKAVYYGGSYKITTQGRIYFDLKNNEWKRFLKRSVLIPAVVALIMAIITTEITLFLKSLW